MKTDFVETSTWTVGSLLSWAAEDFQTRGLEDARRASEVLLAHALGLSRVDIYLRHDQPVGKVEKGRFRTLVEKRREGTPVAYLMQEKEFYSLPFYVDSRVLVPRPETELLVDEVLEEIKACHGEAPSICEVGLGSGAMAIALKKQCSQAVVTAVEISRAALEVAQKNIQTHQVDIRLVQGDLLSALKGPFDLVMANLPYVPTEDWEGLPIDVRNHEPEVALLAGEDGLSLIRTLIRQAGELLPSGSLVLEIGLHQAEPVRQDLVNAGYKVVRTRTDYGEIPRVIVARKGGRCP